MIELFILIVRPAALACFWQGTVQYVSALKGCQMLYLCKVTIMFRSPSPRLAFHRSTIPSICSGITGGSLGGCLNEGLIEAWPMELVWLGSDHSGEAKHGHCSLYYHGTTRLTVLQGLQVVALPGHQRFPRDQPLLGNPHLQRAPRRLHTQSRDGNAPRTRIRACDLIVVITRSRSCVTSNSFPPRDLFIWIGNNRGYNMPHGHATCSSPVYFSTREFFFPLLSLFCLK